MSSQKELFEEEKKKPSWIKDEEGFFLLDRVKINYKFEADKYGLPHLEFKSAEDKKPNLISETGYQSWFIDWDLTESVLTSVKSLIEEYCKAEIKQGYTLEFEKTKELTKIKDDIKDDGWKEINELSKRCKENNEEYAYMYLKYTASPDLDGKHEAINISTEETRSSWGSDYWDIEDENNSLDKLKEKIVSFVKNNALKPYHPELEGIATQKLKRENVVISFSKKARKYLTSIGFDFNELEKELKKIKQRKATKEDINKSKQFKVMEETLNKLQNDCYAIRGYFDTPQNYLFIPSYVKKDYYTDKLKDLEIDTSDLNKLRELYNKKAGLYKKIYMKVYKIRWGEETDEKNAYP